MNTYSGGHLMYQNMQIDYYVNSDWGGRYSDEDQEAFVDLLCTTLRDTYPGARVNVQLKRQRQMSQIIVTTRDHEGRILTDGPTLRGELAIVDTCQQICDGIFDRGDFWVADNKGGLLW